MPTATKVKTRKQFGTADTKASNPSQKQKTFRKSVREVVPYDGEWSGVKACSLDLKKFYSEKRPHHGQKVDTVFACYAFTYQGKRYAIINREAIRNGNLDRVVSAFEPYCKKVFVESFGDAHSPLHKVLKHQLGNTSDITLMNFYSPSDLEGAMGWDLMEVVFEAKDVEQKRCMYGDFVVEGVNYKVEDLKGMAQGSLSAFAGSLGMENDWKQPEGVEPLDKSRMVDEMNDRPEVMAPYVMSDADQLPEMKARTVQARNDVMEAVGINPELYYTLENIPKTTGAQVAGIIERYILDYVKGLYAPVWRYCLYKQGILKENSKKLSRGVQAAIALAKAGRSTIDDAYLKARRGCSDSPLDIMLRVLETTKLKNGKTLAFKAATASIAYEHTAYSQASVQHFATFFNTSAKFNALVLGGRCEREWKDRYVWDTVADADFKSAYAGLLRAAMYPVGLPTIEAHTDNEDPMTFGEFRKKVMPKCGPNWQVSLNGMLPGKVRQDLIHSKVCDGKDILGAILSDYDKKTDSFDDARDSDISHIPGQFILLKDEMVNAVLTPELWATASAVMSNAEMKAFDSLEVNTAAYYLSEDCTEDAEEWMTDVLLDTGSFRAAKRTGRVKDTRTRKTLLISFEGLFGVTTDIRNRLKNEAKEAKKAGQSNAGTLNAKQEAMKLFNNTGYGVLASPFFTVGNTVVANRITSGIRVAAWWLAKAADVFGIITDGGAYQLNRVRTLDPGPRAKLPSLTVFSQRKSTDAHRAVKLGPLDGRKDWTEVLKEAASNKAVPRVAQPRLLTSEEQLEYGHEKGSDLDLLLTRHVREFAGHYGIIPAFSIEHKDDHTALLWACLGKADYAAITTKPDYATGSDRFYKVRGAKQYGRKGDECLKRSPKYDILDAMLDGKDEYPEDFQYDRTHLLSIGEWCHYRTQKVSEYKASLHPGDEVYEVFQAKLNNKHCELGTNTKTALEDFTARDRRKTVRKVKGVTVHTPLFERHASEGIAKVERRMCNDRLDRMGQRR